MEPSLYLKRHLAASAVGCWLSMYRISLAPGGLMATHQSTGAPSAFRQRGPPPALAAKPQRWIDVRWPAVLSAARNCPGGWKTI